ncbi:glutathione S-transferase family protein [Devosia sp.]|uniref:glutathione S-transferase family protein n=1 Tax=Devosia sp. TaxID=1871048 RepID=UPI00326547C4
MVNIVLIPGRRLQIAAENAGQREQRVNRMLRILGRDTSINVRKVLWAAGELGLAYENEVWGLPLRDPKVPEFLALNPNGQVPVIVDDGFVLWESNAILLYLSEKHGQGGLWPTDPQVRALALQWLGWQASELNPPWGYAVRALIRKEAGFDDPAKVADSVAKWTDKMALLEAHLAKGGSFVAGEQFSFADIALALSLHRWFELPYQRQAMPAAEAYYQGLRGRAAGAQWMTARTP